MKIATKIALLTVTCFALPTLSNAQVLFENELDSSTGWSLVHESDPSDNVVIFGHDYSAFGIPEAPNSQAGDTPTSGLRMESNRDLGATNSVAAFPTGMSFTGQYTYQFDLWMNAVGPFPLGGAGSTEFGGGAVGFDNSTTTPLSGATLLVTGEGGSSSDWRLYANDEFQLFSTHADPDTGVNDLYDANLPSANADPNDYLGPIFPGKTAPAVQLNPSPPVAGLDQSGTLIDGTLGFRWSTFKFTVDTDAATAFVQVTDAETDVTADIGTFDLTNTYVNRDTIETKLITSFEGNIALIYRDLFSSIVDPEALTEYTFGIFDNVIVEQVTAGGLDGDFNDDGTVDAADYTVWRDNLGTSNTLPNDTTPGTVSTADYLDWNNNFGSTAGSGTGSAVPEPASIMLVLVGLIGFARRR